MRPMKNLHPIGIPYSIFFEDLFAKTYDSTKLEEDQERIEDVLSGPRILHGAYHRRQGEDRGRRRREGSACR